MISSYSLVSLIGLALMATLANTIMDQRSAAKQLQAVKIRLAPELEKAAKVEAQLDALAGGTARLAEAGNVNAMRIVEVMARNGVQISKGREPAADAPTQPAN